MDYFAGACSGGKSARITLGCATLTQIWETPAATTKVTINQVTSNQVQEVTEVTKVTTTKVTNRVITSNLPIELLVTSQDGY